MKGFCGILPSVLVSAGLCGGCTGASSEAESASQQAAAQSPEAEETAKARAVEQEPTEPPAPEKATASHILITYAGAARASTDIKRSKEEARALALDVLQRAKDGEDFAALAREHSDGPSGPRGGQLGTFPRGRMVPAFDEAVFELVPGSLAPDLVETPFGFHIVYREK